MSLDESCLYKEQTSCNTLGQKEKRKEEEINSKPYLKMKIEMK